MNLLLLEPHEVGADGVVALADRRAAHLRNVLRVQPGQRVRAGIVGGGAGEAEVVGVDGERVVMRVVGLGAAEPRPVAAGGTPAAAADVLLLAIPRPKALLRVLEAAAAFGYARVLLFRTWRVDRSWLSSRALRPDVQREHLLLGCEQAGRTVLPIVEAHLRFRPFVEDVLPGLPLPSTRVCAHPHALLCTSELTLARAAPFAAAIGPDGGFLPNEVAVLAANGFVPVRCGPRPLRTDHAFAALHGQLDLLRARG